VRLRHGGAWSRNGGLQDFELSFFWGFELDSNGDAMGIDRAGIYGRWDYGGRRVFL
jgi:hypothetical protein